MRKLAIISLVMLGAGCTEATTPEVSRNDTAMPMPSYQGVKTQLLDRDLVQFQVALKGATTQEAVRAYAECAAAQYTLIRGYSFARHIRTNIKTDADRWTADAVYTISPDLPRGLRTIDAEVVALQCADNRIPMV